MERSRAWHAVSAAEALAALGSDVNGLSDTEARQRLDAHGANRLPEQRREGPSQRLVAQFRETLRVVRVSSRRPSRASRVRTV